MEQKQLKQFTFYDLYWDLIRQSDDEMAGRLSRNICRYMFTDEIETEDAYFTLAKRKLELSRTRKIIGRKGGKQERIKVTSEEIEKKTRRNKYLGFDEFMKLHPNVRDDLYASRQHLLNGVDWA